MSVIYRFLLGDDASEHLVPTIVSSTKAILNLDGSHQASSVSISVRLIDKTEGGYPLQPAAFLALAPHLFCVRDMLRRKLEVRLEGKGEWIKLLGSPQETWAFHCTNLLDAIDFRASQVTRCCEGGPITNVLSYTFIEEAVKGQLIFRDKRVPMLDLLCTDELRVELIDLGAPVEAFKKLWES